MNIRNLYKSTMLAVIAFAAVSCSKSNDNSTPVTGESVYALGIGVTGSDNVNVNYMVAANSLTTGTITPIGNGLTLTGYRDYAAGNKSVFAIGGLGEVNANGIDYSATAPSNLVLTGSSVFPRALNDIFQIDDTQMMGIEIPTQTVGSNISFYFVNIASKQITKTITSPTAPLVVGANDPIYTGWAINGNKFYLSYMHFDASYGTNLVDRNYIAVFSYPEMVFQQVFTDTRTGPTGAWQTKNGLFKVENGDIYAMSSSNISNGFSQSLKPGGFLRIKSGATTFDPTYFFNTDLLGGKISHIKYLGNGIAIAAISTLTSQTAADRWGDKNLKISIIDLNASTIKDVTGVPIHNGVGGRSFPVYVEGGNVFYPVTTADGTYIYQINVASLTATRGAKITGTFVGGIFKIK
ncbi:protein of unknown function [Pedobacter westerhofensis]|uniref:DUF4374 domain-containing protein n=1 Tax=Pedobacter westerhofensis TaxID=425512 RepID=A0A521F5P1_9SPHI|nr:DUF4374 domain-containing protein [Pedobacter westerhofensis]SMO91485.1 protein of unknown function [Pedobacter westerhofensis]